MYVKVRVQTDAKKEKLEVVSEGRIKISVKEPAEQNLANKKVVEIVANYFKIPKTRVRIKSGHHAPSKILSIEIA